MSKQEQLLEFALQAMKVKFRREYKFLHDRKFRFDFAFPEKKVAVEIEGGIFAGGRHTTGAGFSKDCEKYNLATLNGWKLLRYPTNQFSKNGHFKIAEEIKEFLQELENAD